MRISFWGRVACSALAYLSACAGGARSTTPAQQPATAAPSANDAAESRATQKSAAPPAGASAAEMAAPRAEFSAPPAAAPAPPSPDIARKEAPGAADPHSPSAGARMRLSQARREFEIATSERDCARACRALESMERAAQQVCELARSPEERRECTSAGEQVDKARSKVQSSCGGCSQKFW